LGRLAATPKPSAPHVVTRIESIEVGDGAQIVACGTFGLER
jgi:hypothetical protein